MTSRAARTSGPVGRRRCLWAGLAAWILAAVCSPGPAPAAAGLETAIEDERILLQDPVRAPAVVARWAEVGVEAVRIHARWWQIAPGAYERRRPEGFRPADPDDRRYRWDELDRAVGLVRDAGMKVQLTVTGPGPLWASRAPARRDPRWKPDPRDFAAFARAVSRRYRARVARYLLWNEPNIAGWLSPQSTCRGSGGTRACAPVAPHLYRSLVRAAVPAIRANDPGAMIVIGELAPIGEPLRSESSTIAPLRFLREMACVDDRFRTVRGGRCARFRPAGGDAFGHHPHGKLKPPDRPSRPRDWVKMADLGRLTRTLDRLARAGRIRAPEDRFDLYLTEFGYQTSPPDHFSGIPVARQAAWLQKATYIAWRNPRVKSLTYYQWEDEPVRWRGTGSIAYAGWQSGLFYVDGEPKPAYHAFLSPFVVERSDDRGGGGARVWGQIRSGAAHTVQVERRTGAEWTAVAEVRTDARGYFLRRLPVSAGQRLRLTWPGPRPPSARRRSGSVRVAGAAASALAAPSRFP